MKKSMKKSAMKGSSMKKRAKNAFFTIMLAAKKKNAPSFVYNMKTYKKKTKIMEF